MKIKKVLLSASLLACTFVVAACTTKKPKPTGDKPGETTVIPSTGETPVTSGDTPVTTSETPEVEKVTVTFMVDNDTYLTKKVEKGTATSKPADPIKDGFDFKCWLLNGEEFNFDTEIDEDITLAAEFEASIVEVSKIGFGPNLTSWKELVDIAGVDEVDGKYVLGKDVYDKGFTFVSNGKNRVNANYASYNNQSGTIEIYVNKPSKLVVNGSWGSSSEGSVYVKNGSTDVYKSSKYPGTPDGGTPADISFEVELAAGTYQLSSDKAINITEIYVEREASFANVSYFTEHGDAPKSVKVEIGYKLSILPADLKADGWIFKGWFMDQNFTTPATADTVIEKSTTIYANWVEYNPDNYATVSFDSETSGENFDPIVIEKGQKISLPVLAKEGYTFYGWYKEATFENRITSSTAINETMTLYAKFVQLLNVSFIKDNTILAQVEIEKGEAVGASYIPQAPYQAGYEFTYWSVDGENEFDFETPINDNTNIIPVYVAATPVENAINILDAGASFESLYAEFDAYAEATEYNAYVKSETGSYTKLDTQLIRKYKDGNKEYYRVDAVGLKAGKYTLKVAPVVSGSEVASAATEVNNFVVKPHDRTGFAFSKDSPLAGKTVGAYNLDGTLKSNARVLYVTEDTKDKVTLSVIVDSKGKEQTFTGVGNISQAMSKGFETRPLVLRLIGKVTQSGLTNNNDKLNLGFKECYKGLTQDQIANAGITIEGIGNDATLYGAGVRCLKSSNIEIRNLGFLYWPDDGIALESANINIWVHNCDIFYGAPGSDADQVKGDGSMDLKDDSKFITMSYLHFWDSGKMSLCGMKSETGPNYITYHHNWFDHSDSRHPRIRTMSVHVYNNYYDGVAKYGVGVTTGADAFVEGNYFRNCKYPMLSSLTGTDAADGTFSGESAGTIKAYDNYIEGAKTLTYANADKGIQGATTAQNSSSYDAVLAETRDQVIPNTYNAGGATYNNFDTTIDLGVTADQIESPVNARNTTMSYAGRLQGGDFKWTFDNSVEDANYNVIPELKNAVMGYTSKLVSVQGIESSGSGSDTPTPVEVTVDDVIAMIEALPESTAVTAANKQEINAAKTAFNSLSEDNQALVTNADKLAACVAALEALIDSGSHIMTFNNGTTDPTQYFTVSGNLKSGVASKTYDGVTYTTALKMEQNTTISFTCQSTVTLTIITDTASKKIVIDGTKYTTNADGVVSIELAKGTHTITKGDSINVYAVIVE